MILTNVVMALVLAFGTPTDPPQKQVSAWGTDQSGLRCRVQTTTMIEQHKPLDVSLELQCIPQSLKPGVKQLNTFLSAAYLTLSLSNRKTGKTFTVQPYDPTCSMLAQDTGRNVASLDRTALKPWSIRFPLVRLENVLEPGSYDCRVRYTFPEKQTGWWHGTAAQWQAAGFWFGTVESATFRLEIRKETPHTQTFLLPRRLRLEKGLRVVFGRDEVETVQVPVRNGYFLAAHVYRNGQLYQISGVPQPNDVNALDYWSDYKKGDRKVSYTIEIFETADPLVHKWHPGPGSGGYRVLWRRTLTLALTEQEIRQMAP